MQTFIIIIHLMVVVAMIGVVLLQKSEGGGLGIGSAGGFLSSRGTANVLTRATAILAATFFATSLVLSILAGFSRNPTSILRNTSAPASPAVPGAPAAPSGGGGLLDQLRQQENSAPAAPGGAGAPAPAAPAPPAAPGGPQVPQSQ